MKERLTFLNMHVCACCVSSFRSIFLIFACGWLFDSLWCNYLSGDEPMTAPVHRFSYSPWVVFTAKPHIFANVRCLWAASHVILRKVYTALTLLLQPTVVKTSNAHQTRYCQCSQCYICLKIFLLHVVIFLLLCVSCTSALVLHVHLHAKPELDVCHPYKQIDIFPPTIFAWNYSRHKLYEWSFDQILNKP